MRTLHRFVLVDFLVNFAISLAVLTLVLYMGAIMKALDYVAKGVPGAVLVQIFTLNIPYILTFSIPISIITATLLLFGRLSMEGEYTAMRAGGISTWQIISPVVLASLAFTLICLFIQVDVAPKSRFALRKALVDIEEIDPVDLLDEGRFVRFPRLEIYITHKNGYKLKDIEVYELDGRGSVVQTIRAKTGTVEPRPDLMLMRVMLQDAQVQYPDGENPADLTRARVIDMENYDFDVSYEELLRDKDIIPKLKDMTARQLLACIGDVNLFYDLQGDKREARRMQAIVEAHKRITLSVACLAFTLIGIPLGIKSKRKESSSGIGVSLLVVVVFYGFIIAAENLTRKPWAYPDMILWVPTVFAQGLGLVLLRRMR